MKNTLGDRKARGAFYTPPEIADFLSSWAIRSPDDRVLEPSCGEAIFLSSASNRLLSLGLKKEEIPESLVGLDIHSESVERSGELLSRQGINLNLQVSDFFDFRTSTRYDAVIGNPPYIRYQSFTGKMRAKALETAIKQGVRLNKLASSWAAFTVHASSFLKLDGRLALVLPAELLSVKYAGKVRRFLLERFAKVRLVLFEELVFPGVLEEVVLLLAEGYGGTDKFEVYQTKDIKNLNSLGDVPWINFSPKADDKWTNALISPSAVKVYDELLSGEAFELLINWGETYLGAVTGNNKYFALTRKKCKHINIKNEYVKISPPGSRHLRSLRFTETDIEELDKSGVACRLFYPADQPSKAAHEYISQGEAVKVHEAYKCKKRNPWWRVPLVSEPDLILTYMDQHRPRLIWNQAKAHVLNSVYGVKLYDGRQHLVDLLPLVFLNSLTLLGTEILGRSYGGGILKIEPKEADRLPMPSMKVLEENANKLRDSAAHIEALVKRGNIFSATRIVDRILLHNALGLDYPEVHLLRKSREYLQERRTNRGKSQNGKS